MLLGSKGIGNRFEEQRLTLRIHRGRGSNYHESPHSNGSTHSTTTSLGSASPERLSRFTTRKHEKVKISVSYPSSENISSPTNNQTNQLYAVHYTVNGKETQASHLYRGNSTAGRRSSNISNNNNNINKDFLCVTDKATSPRASKKMGKRNIKAQVKKFRMETKGEFRTISLLLKHSSAQRWVSKEYHDKIFSDMHYCLSTGMKLFNRPKTCRWNPKRTFPFLEFYIKSFSPELKSMEEGSVQTRRKFCVGSRDCCE